MFQPKDSGFGFYRSKELCKIRILKFARHYSTKSLSLKPLLVLDNLDDVNFLSIHKDKLKNKCGIYAFREKLSEKQYIGQSKDLHQRVYRHLNSTHSNFRLQRAIDKHGLKNFELLIYEYCDPKNVSKLSALEVKYITYFDAETLYNFRVEEADSGTELRLPKKTMEEISQLIDNRKKAAGSIPFEILPGFELSKDKTPVSVTKLEVKQTETPKQVSRTVDESKRTIGFTGQRHSEEFLKKISKPGPLNPMFGKTHSLETRAKIASAKNVRVSPNGVGVFDLNDRLVGKFVSDSEIAKYFNISKCTVGRYRSKGKIFNDKYTIKYL